MSTPAVAEAKDREQLHKKFAEMGLRGYWQLERDDHLIFKPVPCPRMTDASASRRPGYLFARFFTAVFGLLP